jgi:acetyl-CoA C-acetyltransferase
MKKSGVTDDHLAKIVARSRRLAAKNPYARENKPITEQDVLNSPMMADPIRQLHQYPVTDWAVGMLLCCEERAREFTDNPVFLTGFGSCMDSYFLGDRDLTGNFALKKAAQRAYRMAGVSNPKKEFDIVEINDAMAYQLPMWAEGLGIADESGGGRWVGSGEMDARHVNLSGGMLNGNPIMLGGLARATEAILQLRGDAGDRQVEGARKALAHGTTGAAGQHHAVIILEKQGV